MASDKNDQQNHETTLEERPRKRKHVSPTGPGHEQSNNDNTTTPRKSTKNVFATPSHPRTTAPISHPSQLDPYDSPSTLRQLFSPSAHKEETPLKAAVGPTPQRDGKALGLFDLLSESGGSTATPSANRVAGFNGAALQTPSRRNRMETIIEDNEEEQEEEDTPRGGRTPASSGKKWYLANLFATPTTLRYAAMVEDEEEPKPVGAGSQAAAAAARDKGSASKGVMAGSDTPSFLRRSNPGRSFDPATGGLSPIAARKPPQFVGRGLSTLVQGLRDMEEERLEEDLDVLREIEADQETVKIDNIEMEDNQNATENTGRRPYKKKGQKRTTRRVRMKPVVVSKPQTNTNQSQPPEEENDGETGESEDELPAIPDTQLGQTANQLPDQDEDEDDVNASLHTISEPDLDSDPDYDEPVTKTKSFSEKMQEAISADPKNQPQKSSQATDKAAKVKEKAKEKEKKEKEKEKEKESKPRARKVNPEAHANYRSLKLGPKGRGRGAGRFGRR